jgi:hypothetical protein
VRALSIHQPWPELILRGRKQFEIRPQPTKLRGRIWVHAGLAYDPSNVEQAGLVIADLPRGAIVGTVEIVGCEPFTEKIAEEMRAAGAYFGMWSEGRYAWVLANPCRLTDPIPLRGQLGLFSVPVEVEHSAVGCPSL